MRRECRCSMACACPQSKMQGGGTANCLATGDVAHRIKDSKTPIKRHLSYNQAFHTPGFFCRKMTMVIHLPVVKRIVGPTCGIPQHKRNSRISTRDNLAFHQARHIIDLPADIKSVDHLLEASRKFSSCSVTTDVRSKIGIPWEAVSETKAGPLQLILFEFLAIAFPRV